MWSIFKRICTMERYRKMRLDPSPFDMIKRGSKTIELRLYDEKRRSLRAGDSIVFICRQTGERLTCTVKALHVFENFKKLYSPFDLIKCGYTAENVKSANADDMLKYYSLAELERFGVVGIELTRP